MNFTLSISGAYLLVVCTNLTDSSTVFFYFPRKYYSDGFYRLYTWFYCVLFSVPGGYLFVFPLVTVPSYLIPNGNFFGGNPVNFSSDVDTLITEIAGPGITTCPTVINGLPAGNPCSLPVGLYDLSSDVSGGTWSLLGHGATGYATIDAVTGVLKSLVENSGFFQVVYTLGTCTPVVYPYYCATVGTCPSSIGGLPAPSPLQIKLHVSVGTYTATISPAASGLWSLGSGAAGLAVINSSSGVITVNTAGSAPFEVIFTSDGICGVLMSANCVTLP